MAEPIYYLNGQFLEANRAALPLNDLAVVRGYGVFDLLRTYGLTPFRLQDHLIRLQSSAAQIGIELPWTLAELETVVYETHVRNELEDASIRIIVTGGLSDNFMTPHQMPSLVVMVNPLVPYAAEDYVTGRWAITTQIERIMPTVKSINYIGAIMAMAEAKKANAVEAIYRTPDGSVTEGTRSNLFLIQDGVLITPETGILPGITRKVVLEIAQGYCPVRFASLRYTDIQNADEAFFTSTTKEIMPLVGVDDYAIGTGKPGPITLALMERFREYVAQVTVPLQA
jgi:branched-chain amino acid aminotransferase